MSMAKKDLRAQMDAAAPPQPSLTRPTTSWNLLPRGRGGRVKSLRRLWKGRRQSASKIARGGNDRRAGHRRDGCIVCYVVAADKAAGRLEPKAARAL